MFGVAVLETEPAEDEAVLLEAPAERDTPVLPTERDAELIERLAVATLETEDDLDALPEVTLLAPEAEAEAVPVRTRRPTPATDCLVMPVPWALVAMSLSMI